MDHSRNAQLIGWNGSRDGWVPRQYVLWREVILPRHVDIDSLEGLDCWTRNCSQVFGYTVGVNWCWREISVEFLQSEMEKVTGEPFPLCNGLIEKVLKKCYMIKVKLTTHIGLRLHFISKFS